MSVKTEDSLFGNHNTIESKLHIFDKKCDAYNPFGWSVIFKNHWNSDPDIFEYLMMDNTDFEKEIIEWIDKMKKAIDNFSN